jgi:3-methylcrotonyl-CoA carboxylase alpha subunit
MTEDSCVRIAAGVFTVVAGDRRETVYVAGSASDRWAFWNGHVFHSTSEPAEQAGRPAGAIGTGVQSLAAPMPATVVNVVVAPGARVTKGDTLVLLEAMKMELPIRALGDGIVKAVHCRAGDLVRADQELVEIESIGAGSV